MTTDSDLLERVLRSDPRAVGRAMRLVDDDLPGSRDLLKALWRHAGKAWVLGVTGTPGAGKSTLCDQLITAFRTRGQRVGVVAVDPSSPYSGGAILGDRIRMSRHATDDGVFIRSLATRGHLGGLTRSTRDVVCILDASGFDIIIVETVGVGQDELEVARMAHTTVVVTAPGLGDDVQAIKAGILESADVFVVNKADREGADATVRDLLFSVSMLDDGRRSPSRARGHIAHGPAGREANASSADHGLAERWTPPVLKSIAVRGEGVPALLSALDHHRAWVEGTEAGKTRRRARLTELVRDSLRESLLEAALRDLGPRLDEATAAVDNGGVDPYTAIEQLIAAFRGDRGT